MMCCMYLCLCMCVAVATNGGPKKERVKWWIMSLEPIVLRLGCGCEPGREGDFRRELDDLVEKNIWNTEAGNYILPATAIALRREVILSEKGRPFGGFDQHFQPDEHDVDAPSEPVRMARSFRGGHWDLMYGNINTHTVSRIPDITITNHAHSSRKDDPTDSELEAIFQTTLPGASQMLVLAGSGHEVVLVRMSGRTRCFVRVLDDMNVSGEGEASIIVVEPNQLTTIDKWTSVPPRHARGGSVQARGSGISRTNSDSSSASGCTRTRTRTRGFKRTAGTFISPLSDEEKRYGT